MSAQLVFLDNVERFISEVPAPSVSRDYAVAGLQLLQVAKSSYRHQLSSWCWRRLARERVGDRRAHEVLFRIATLIRSNTGLRGGSLMDRVERLLGEHNVRGVVLRDLMVDHALGLRIRRELAAMLPLGTAALDDNDSEPESDETMFSVESDAEET